MVTIDFENDGQKLVIYAMDEQSIFGRLICEPEEDEVFRLKDIYVSEAWRRQGYGRSLIEAAHDIIGGYLGADELYAGFVRHDGTMPFYELLLSMGYQERSRDTSNVYCFSIADVEKALQKAEKLADNNNIWPLSKCTRGAWSILSEKIVNLSEPVLIQDKQYYDQEYSMILYNDNEEPVACILVSRGRDGKSRDILLDCLYNGGSPKELPALICKSYMSVKNDLGTQTKIYANMINEQMEKLLKKLTGEKLVKAGVSVVMSFAL